MFSIWAEDVVQRLRSTRRRGVAAGRVGSAGDGGAAFEGRRVVRAGVAWIVCVELDRPIGMGLLNGVEECGVRGAAKKGEEEEDEDAEGGDGGDGA